MIWEWINEILIFNVAQYSCEVENYSMHSHQIVIYQYNIIIEIYKFLNLN